MVSKELQNKFYAALESLKDGQNDYILEALAAGAKATFEGLIAGTLTDDGTYIPPANERQVECNIGPGACKRVFTKDDLMKLIHDPSTEENEDPVDLVDHFDDRSGNRFPSYDGQFDEEPEYSMVAEAISKLGKAICDMKTDDNASIMEAIHEGFKTCFEGTQYGYQWEFNTPGEEPLVSKFGTPDYSANYDSNDRLSYAKNLAEKAKMFGEQNPRFGKTMTKAGKDGSYVSLTPMRREWDDEYRRFGIPKAIRRRVDQLIAENGWDIVLDKSGYAYDKQNKRHNEIPEKYVWISETADPVIIEEITRTLAPLGFKHDTETHEAHYGFTGHGPIDTETFSVDVWKYTDKPVSPMVAEAVAKFGNTINDMKTDDNTSLLEAIHEGFSACFESSEGQEAKARFPIMFADEDCIEDAEVEKVKAGDTTALVEKLRAGAHPAGKGFARPEGRMFTEHHLADIINMHTRMVAQDEERGRFAKCILDDPNEKAWFFDDYNSEGEHVPWATYIKW